MIFIFVVEDISQDILAFWTIFFISYFGSYQFLDILL